jgi:pyridoxamine 5'-phosphate oxidase
MSTDPDALDPAALDPDPLRQFATWLAEAEAADLVHPSAFALATADGHAAPSVRMVLLRGYGPDGFRFFTDRRSRKGRDLAVNPRAAAAFSWPELGRQVRLHGPVEPLGEEESATYFVTRPRGSRLSAWASEQGAEIGARAELEARVAALDAHFPGEEVPLPPHWGGYRITPEAFEFWRSRPDRLHDRVEYRRGPDGAWIRRRLQP